MGEFKIGGKKKELRRRTTEMKVLRIEKLIRLEDRAGASGIR